MEMITTNLYLAIAKEFAQTFAHHHFTQNSQTEK